VYRHVVDKDAVEIQVVDKKAVKQLVTKDEPDVDKDVVERQGRQTLSR
jgi:hypothetical protein